jgi:ABC-type lipoprotein export system ATPase subunit
MANVVLQQRLSGVSADAARDRAEPLLDRLGVAHLARRRPGTLSGGEAQRVAVCAALAHGPRLLLADEPTGELDVATAEGLYRALADAVAAVGAAMVLVSHDRRAAGVADRVVRIRDGRLSETWTPSPDGGPVAEHLVVDDRGWVRLPDAVGHGIAVAVRTAADGSITLRSTGSAGLTAEPAEPAVTAEPAAPADPGRREGGAVLARLRGVHKAYGGHDLLAGVDLDVPAGRLIAVRGPSGSGKSTLVRVLLGLEPPDAGTVELDGADLAGLDRDARARLRRHLLAHCGQQVHLVDTADAATNLDLALALHGLAADPAEVARALQRVHLADRRHRPAGRLSGGERQRLALARALVVRPRLLVCDEPTSRLDEANAQRVAAVLAEQARQGCAVVVASHDPVLLAAVDEVLDLGRPAGLSTGPSERGDGPE